MENHLLHPPIHDAPVVAGGALDLRSARAGINWLSMLGAGLVTTAIAMYAVHYAQVRYRESVLDWYVYHVLPVGALGVGLLAASGYLLGAIVLHARVSRRRAWLIVGLQVAAYFVAQYVEFRSHHYVYRDTHQRVGFWEWFNLVATSYVLHRPEGDQPLGYVGYLFRVLEVAAFGAGAFVLTAPLSGTSYCHACGRYRKHKHFATIPAGTFVAAVGEGEDVTEEAVVEGGRAAFDSIATIARAGDAATVLQHVAEFPPLRASQALGSRLDLELHYCPGCMDAALEGRIIVKKPLTSTVRFLPRVVVPVAFAEPIAEPRSHPGIAGDAP